MKNAAFLFLLAAAISFISCSKDDDDKGPDLTGQRWKMTSFIINVDAFPVPYDAYAEMEACEQDNLTIFDEGGSYTVEEGATKCNPNDPDQYSSGTWKISGNGKKITVTESGMELEGDIAELTASKFVVKNKMNYGGYSGMATLKYEAL